MEIREIVEPRQRLVDGRVVFHRARAKRINALVQVEIHPTQPAVMAGKLRLMEKPEVRWLGWLVMLTTRVAFALENWRRYREC